jgi:hypothetical protein
MSDILFILNYKKTKIAPPETATDYNKTFPTRTSALNFCVVLTKLGGEAVELVQKIHGEEDAVLDGPELEQAVDSQRTHLNAGR